ncbi:MAG: hypothetical protein ACK58T_05770, partial [Phycisphaerae bacterium]
MPAAAVHRQLRVGPPIPRRHRADNGRMKPYTLLFAPIFKDKVWGGRALEALGKTLPAGNIGESWELVDLDSTSVSGGGGGAEHSR